MNGPTPEEIEQYKKEIEEEKSKKELQQKVASNINDAKKIKDSASDLDPVWVLNSRFKKLAKASNNALKRVKGIDTEEYEISEKKKEDLTEKANNLQDDIDLKIKSIAYNKFVFRKAKKLKELGKNREEINVLIEDLEKASIKETMMDKIKSGIFGFGIDKNFVGLSVDEIIKKVNQPALPAHSIKELDSSLTSSAPELLLPEDKPEEPTDNKQLQKAISDNNDSRDDLSVITKRVDSLEGYVQELQNQTIEIPELPDLTGDDVNSISEKPTKEPSSTGPVKPNTGLELQWNADTDSIDDIDTNNEKIYDYLIKTGEIDIADYVLDLMTKPKVADDTEKLSEIQTNTEAVKELTVTEKKISEVLNEINENMVDEQDTSITQASPSFQPTFDYDSLIKDAKSTKDDKPEDESGGLLSSILGALGLGAAAKTKIPKGKMPKPSKVSKVSKIGSKLKNLIRMPKAGPAVAGLAVAASAGYIGSELNKRQEQYELATTEDERIQARTAQGAGISGAITGAIAGGKAMGSIGAMVGTMGFPGIGTAIGGGSGFITGLAAGAAAGYYMGDGVSEYIAEMWSGPLDKIPDEQKSNPFTLHEFITKSLIPEWQDNLVKASNMTPEEREEAKLNIEDLQDGIQDYNDIALELMTPDSIQEWMERKIEDNGLEDASYKTKQEYLQTLMQQFVNNEHYYNIGNAEINEVAPTPSLAQKIVGDVTFGLFGDDSHTMSEEDKAEEKKQLEAAKRATEFNQNNTLGKNGVAINISADNHDKNFDELVKNGIIEDNTYPWPNTVAEGGFDKLKQMPVQVLEGLVADGGLKESDEKVLNNIIAEKKAKVEKEQTKLETPVKAPANIDKLTEQYQNAYNNNKSLKEQYAEMKASMNDENTITETINGDEFTDETYTVQKFKDPKVQKKFIKLKRAVSKSEDELRKSRNAYKTREIKQSSKDGKYSYKKIAGTVLSSQDLAENDFSTENGMSNFEKIDNLNKEYDEKIITSLNAGQETEGSTDDNQLSVPQKVTYEMKTSTGSTSPDDYKTSDLFKMYKVNEEDINGVHPTVLSNLKSMAAEYKDIYGDRIQINSAYRSFKEQAELKDKLGRKAASPGKSMHNYGLAIDMNSVNAERAIAAGLFRKYGFTRPVPGETWHVEPDGIDRKKIREKGMQAGNAEAGLEAAGITEAPDKKTPETPDVPTGNESEGSTETSSKQESVSTITKKIDNAIVDKQKEHVNIPVEDKANLVKNKLDIDYLTLAKEYADKPEKLDKMYYNASDKLDEFEKNNKGKIYYDEYGETQITGDDKLQKEYKTLKRNVTLYLRTSEVLKKYTKVETPQKSSPEDLPVMDNETPEQKAINNKLTSLENDITKLQRERNIAAKNGKKEKARTINKTITQKKNELNNINKKKTNNIHVNTKNDISKDSKIQDTEEMYTSTLNDTKNYDSKRAKASGQAAASQININSNNIHQTPSEDVGVFDVFDNLQLQGA